MPSVMVLTGEVIKTVLSTSNEDVLSEDTRIENGFFLLADESSFFLLADESSKLLMNMTIRSTCLTGEVINTRLTT